MEGKVIGAEVKKPEGQNVKQASLWMLTGYGWEEERDNQYATSLMNEQMSTEVLGWQQ